MTDSFYQEKIPFFDEFVSELKKSEGGCVNYTFEEVYRYVYIIFKKNPSNAISLYYRCLSKLYENNYPTENDIKIIDDIFMFVKSRLKCQDLYRLQNSKNLQNLQNLHLD